MNTPPAIASWLKLLPVLNERPRRLCAAPKGRELGRGGLKRVPVWTGLSRPTSLKGLAELRGERELAAPERSRRAGGGRKQGESQAPSLKAALEGLVAATTAGEPRRHLRGTLKSTRRLAQELGGLAYQRSADTGCRLRQEWGYWRQAKRKSKDGARPPERAAQFRYLNEQVPAFRARHAPVISVDTQKKELGGEVKNPGREGRRQGPPVAVQGDDLPSLSSGGALPYGTYDRHRNQGLVKVGSSHEPAEVAVERVRQWWRRVGRRQYPQARRLRICADGGGSNGRRTRAWRFYLQQCSDETGLAVTVCHYPPGTSKWNKSEPRRFSFLSLNGRGKPLVSYEPGGNLISSTTPRQGLRINARLDPKG
jgi:Rhodopirellula transposase DDE domain